MGRRRGTEKGKGLGIGIEMEMAVEMVMRSCSAGPPHHQQWCSETGATMKICW